MNSTGPDTLGRLVAAQPLAELTSRLAEVGAASASGLWGSSVAAATAAIERHLGRPVLVICGHVDEADDLADDMELFHGRRPEVLSALELTGNLGRVSEEQVANRLQLVARLAGRSARKNGPDGKTEKPLLLVSPVQAIMQSVPSPRQLQNLILNLTPGQELEPEKLIGDKHVKGARGGAEKGCT